MLRSIKSFEEYLVLASDGEIGSVADFFFDDLEWAVRYLVVDLWKMSPGRKAIISPLATNRETNMPDSFRLSMSKEVIDKSPAFQSDHLISREYEAELANYYGWPAYWANFGGGRSEAESANGSNTERRSASNLWSASEVTGYFIQATDGEIGYVEDFILDDHAWLFRYFVIATQNGVSDKKVLIFSQRTQKSGRKVLVVPQWAERISWGEAKIEVGLSREAIENSAEFDPNAPINRLYEPRFYDYYGRPTQWT